MINQGKLIVFGFVLVLAFVLKTGTAFAEEKAVTVFKEAKCSACHSWTSQGIKGEDETGKTPDLSTISKDVIGNADAKAFLKDFLMKKADLHGKKHKKGFKGSDADLDALVTFILKK